MWAFRALEDGDDEMDILLFCSFSKRGISRRNVNCENGVTFFASIVPRFTLYFRHIVMYYQSHETY